MKADLTVDYTHVRAGYDTLYMSIHVTHREHAISARYARDGDGEGEYVVVNFGAERDSIHERRLDCSTFMTPEQAATLRDQLTAALEEN